MDSLLLTKQWDAVIFLLNFLTSVVRAECACRRSRLGRVRYNTKNSAEDERTMTVQKVVAIYTSPALGVNSMRLQLKDV